jgi:hypothetical protein
MGVGVRWEKRGVAAGGEEVVARTGREIWTTWIWFGVGFSKLGEVGLVYN